MRNQLNTMHPSAINHIAQSKERWQLACGQLFIDFDISEENTPPGPNFSQELQSSKSHPSPTTTLKNSSNALAWTQ